MKTITTLALILATQAQAFTDEDLALATCLHVAKQVKTAATIRDAGASLEQIAAFLYEGGPFTDETSRQVAAIIAYKLIEDSDLETNFIKNCLSPADEDL